jgi:hypothetical protein
VQQSPPHSKTGSQQKTIRSTSIGNVHPHSHYQQQNAARFPRNSSRGRQLKRGRLDSDSSDGGLAKEHEREQRRQKKLELQNRFKLNPEKEADPNYMLGRSRLMIRIHKMEQKAEDVHSEDNMNNSFDESASEISTGEDEAGELDEEERARRKKKRAMRKKKKKKRAMMFLMQQPAKKKPGRRPIINVYCTDYDVVRKAAKNTGFRLREHKEDHDGGIIKEQYGQKLHEEWDVSWHNLGITPDYFAKMQPYQRVNQFPGVHIITRKNTMARNLMKMKKVFPDLFNFFPKTWVMPMETCEFSNQFIDKYGRPKKYGQKAYIVKPDNLA